MARASTPPVLRVSVEDTEVQGYAAAPTLLFSARLDGLGGPPVRSAVLDAQVNVAAAHRAYSAAEQSRLVELFGPPDLWATSLRSLLWTRAAVYVPPFTGSTWVDIPVACTYDFEVTVVKYLQALEADVVPLEFLFSGSVFYTDADGQLQVSRIPWDTTAEFALPLRVWRSAMDLHYAGSAWLRLRGETLGRLHDYKARNTIPTLDEALHMLLDEAEFNEPAETIERVPRRGR